MPQPTITVTVQSSNGSAQFTVPQTTTVAELAQQAAQQLGFQPGPNIALFFNGEELQGNRPLVSYHFPDDATLVLTDTSGGV